MRRGRYAMLAALLAGPLPAWAHPAPLSSWQAGVDAVGPIHLGMTLEQASQAAGLALSEQPRRGDVVAWQACHYAWLVQDQELRLDLGLTLENGVVTRIDVATPEVATRSGVRVGDAESSVFQRYAGRVQVPAAEAGQPRYLVAYPQQPRQLIFRSEDGRVSAYSVGRPPSVQHSEACT
jgi:hypothetical protein